MAFGLQNSSGRRWWSTYQFLGSLELEALAIKNNFFCNTFSFSEIKQNLQNADVHIHGCTVGRRLKEARLFARRPRKTPLHTRRHLKMRLKFERERRGKTDWSKYIPSQFNLIIVDAYSAGALEASRKWFGHKNFQPKNFSNWIMLSLWYGKVGGHLTHFIQIFCAHPAPTPLWHITI